MFFDDCQTLEELKARYRKLAMKHHPDCGGDAKVMKEINAEHDRVFARLKNSYNEKRRAEHKPETTETAEKFREIIDKLIRMKGLDIELCGQWLWIGGETFKHRDELKAAGCQWSRNKRRWYWHHKEDGARWSRGRYSMSAIRTKFGSATFRTERDEDLATA